MSGASLLPIQQRVLDLLAQAATHRRAAPTNEEICGRIGAESTSSATRIVAILEKRGFITVQRFQAGREITIVATGASTAFTGERKPHSHAGRRRNRAQQTAKLVPAAPVALTAEQIEAVRVDRDPSFRCGTRRDVGCRHHPKGE